MSAIDNLPGDQRAVLQLVLSRGRSYDEIARLLSINPDAVRERAVAALRTLGPQTNVDPEAQTAITDYLLGQLPEDQLPAVRRHLAESPGERAWTRVVASELAPLASGPLPEIPTESAGAEAAPDAPEQTPAAEPETAVQPAPSPPSAEGAPPPPAAEPAPPTAEPAPTVATAEQPAGEPERGPRSSRRGGLLVIGLVAAIIVVVVIILVTSGGGSKHPTSSAAASTPTPTTASSPAASATTPSSSSSATTTSTTSSGTSTAAKVVSQINLTPPVAGSKAAGIAEVLREGSTNGIAIVAQNVPPNTTTPPNAYAVWLYNSPTDAKILGFVNPGVPKSGKLSTAGGLPANASHYKQLIVTRETAANPKTPGTIILQGTLTGV